MRRPNGEILISVELLRMILDLPPSYQIVGAHSREPHTIHLHVEAKDLPPIADDRAPRHLVTPVMKRVDTGKAELERLEIIPSEERALWDAPPGPPSPQVPPRPRPYA